MITFHRLGRQGRFGNQLFQIASTVGIARARGFHVGFNAWFNHDHVKHTPGGSPAVRDMFKNRLPALKTGLVGPVRIMPLHYDAAAVEAVNDRDRLSGFMQSEKYFKHCEDEIRYYFQPKEKIYKSFDCCAIHVRRGDYVINNYPLTNLEYYEKAIDRLQIEGFESGTLQIFSDDITAAATLFETIKIKFKNRYQIVYTFSPNPDDYKKDFIEMLSCDYHIISNSSFSWWAAWLSRARVVVAPGVWSFHDNKDIIPSTWIKI